jgi:hypothetical protein
MIDMKIMPINPLSFCFSVCFSLMFCSCTHYYYGPNSNNVPLLQKKDDVRISAGISGSDETTGFELQSAYALGNYFGTMFNVYATGGKETTSDGTSGGNSIVEKGNGNLVEFGLGYFTPLKDKSWIFEFYTGVGGGTVNNEYQMNESSKVGLTRLFFQPSIGYSNPKGTLEAALATKVSSVKFKVKQAKFSGANADTYNEEQVQDIRDNPNNIFVEPSIMVRGGSKNIKLQLQLTGSNSLKNKEFLTQGLNTSLSVIFHFNAAVKK